MPQCETCHRTFGTKEACKQHMDEKRHQKPTKKCDQCNKLFKDRSAAEAHMTQVGHWNPRIPCETCPIKFHTQEAAKQHMAAKNHFKKYCKPCDQRFSSENDLKMHLNSRSHRCAQGSGHASKSTASNINDNIASQPYLNTTLNFKHVKPAATVKENSPKPTEYTVGWICALPEEMAAAKGMLDEAFQAPRQGVLDENIYVVGRIAHLKTVIVCLPYGVAGTTSATRVAEHMRQTFTSLQYTLLVGVGGGIPSKKVDVRLGDVVISVPSPDSPGVVQYDYGKDVQNDRFVTTGHLNQPPARLLSAVSQLRSQEVSGSSGLTLSIAKSIARLQARYSNSERNWSYPGVSNDLLFNSGYNHEGEYVTCARCDADYLEERPQRESTQPKIHYGTIASANRVMRNGATRERLRLDKNALCVEMEAAGLMNNFPCLVIRGICDYADSHKNKDWQPYAAATAAAFAKELLSIMPKHI
ncbi:hypothetical protein LB506_009171 [Fusarium annulatum]|nr:hypothetical protein LB506_009171 [Fusarium annulatum]